jgi:hypothetical protein
MVCSLAVEISLDEVSIEIATICPLISALAVFLAISELANVFRIVTGPYLDAITLLAIVYPVTFVCIALKIGEFTLAIGFVI